VSFLGAIIDVGIVAKNGILMLDFVEHLQAEGVPFEEALVQSGRRRLRPVPMMSMAAALGMLPLAYEWARGPTCSSRSRSRSSARYASRSCCHW